MKKIILLITCIAHFSFADESLIVSSYFECSKYQNDVQERKTVIYFLNGIHTPESKSVNGSLALYYRLNENQEFNSISKNQNIGYSRLYNPMYFIGDAIELSIQAEIQKKARAATDAKMVNMNVTDFYREKVSNALYMSELNEQYQLYWAEAYANDSSVLSSIKDDFGKALISSYQALSYHVVDTLLQGNKVIIVAHSQGNYVAQGIYSYIMSLPSVRESAKTSLRVVGVANVARTTPSNMYTTIAQDAAVLAHMGTGGNPMSFNFDAVFSNGDNLGLPLTKTEAQKQTDAFNHGFIETYLNAQFSKDKKFTPHKIPIMRRGSNPVQFLHQKIVGDVVKAINESEYPEKIAENGIITSTLTWLGDDDIDLYVKEPFKTVFFDEKEGDIGYLDIDDTDGQGPEHYYLQCFDLVEFQKAYKPNSISMLFSVDQYSARKDAPEVVTLGIRIGRNSDEYGGILLTRNSRLKNAYKLEMNKAIETTDKMRFNFSLYKL